MATQDTGDWRDLFDVALFEPNRNKLRQRIERAKHAINERLEALMREASMNDPSEGGRRVSERIALSDALTTLAELHKIVYARKPGASDAGQSGRAAG